jgi:rhodanese-related sulfurtransferase
MIAPLAMALPESVSAKQLAQRLEAGEALLLLDVRELEELALASLPGVVHLPLSDSQNWLGSLPQLLGTDPNLVVMCHGGIRSWQFACWLMETHGYTKVWNLEGGIDAWSVQVDSSVPRY